MSSNTAQVTPTAPALRTEDLARFKARLQDQARALSAQDSELRARLAAEESVTANTFVAGIEGAMAAEADDETIALLHHEQTELVATRQALERIESGDYGYCEECGDAIGVARLEVLPEAHLCVGCQDMLEHRKGR
ncbi:MAG: TraR/DksA family transcriptional regulator [Aquabacterium sp.]|uniref:TraR/DksA family transcriptional regulator n=1 Tax=Aquabacterium sp. TaxID=1872578 RepID=UPI0012235BA6|nr:TraR/DksA family transcriptional regulator [Aquabacterium sp.]TAK96005.1 MAG: TraR/DksA family transcriptional regulator [Aquabacterium sp.]